MAEYTVELKRSAEKELAKLPDDVLGRMVTKLEKLASDPRPNGCEKLKGGSGEYRARVGDYRAVYVVDDVKQLVLGDADSAPAGRVRVRSLPLPPLMPQRARHERGTRHP